MDTSSLAEAKQTQAEMAQRVLIQDCVNHSISFVAGMDVSNNRFDPSQMIFAASVMLSYPDLSVVETSTQANKQTFPYIPGFLSFREAPALIQAFDGVKRRPDVIMVDGHGISHPRALGIASHIGVMLDIPTIGVAKSILIGEPEGILAEEAGSQIPLIWKGHQIAALLRTKKRCAPLIVSAGHKISLDSAVRLVMCCVKGYRLPEPTRQAHLAANACRKMHMTESS